MTELERVKEFIETLEFHGYIDHDPTKLNELIDDYYPLKQGQLLPMQHVSNRCFCGAAWDGITCNHCGFDASEVDIY